jgi:hypothetical protein
LAEFSFIIKPESIIMFKLNGMGFGLSGDMLIISLGVSINFKMEAIKTTITITIMVVTRSAALIRFINLF